MCRIGMEITSAVCFVVLLLVAGCAGTGEILTLDVRAVRASAGGTKSAGAQQQQSVFINVFSDQRPQKNHVGVRTHLWGGVTKFNVEDGRAGDVVARVISEYLTQRGLTVGMQTPGVAELQGQPDIIISGRLNALAARAKSRFGSTVITTNLDFVIKAKNTSDDSETEVHLDDMVRETVVWFDAEDIEAQMNRMLDRSLASAMDDLKVTGGGPKKE